MDEAIHYHTDHPFCDDHSPDCSDPPLTTANEVSCRRATFMGDSFECKHHPDPG
jgi:hypothetical protein